jgi:hypothetical protein
MVWLELEIVDPLSLLKRKVTVAAVAPEFATANPLFPNSDGIRRLGKTKVDWACAAAGNIQKQARMTRLSHLFSRLT